MPSTRQELLDELAREQARLAGEAPLGYAEVIDEPTVEYDQEALRHFEGSA